MNRCTSYMIVGFFLGFLLSLPDFSSFQLANRSFAGGRGRRFIEDDTNDAAVRCHREKLKKKRLGDKYIAPKICDSKLPRNKQRSCLDRDCDVETGQIRY